MGRGGGRRAGGRRVGWCGWHGSSAGSEANAEEEQDLLLRTPVTLFRKVPACLRYPRHKDHPGRGRAGSVPELAGCPGPGADWTPKQRRGFSEGLSPPARALLRKPLLLLRSGKHSFLQRLCHQQAPAECVPRTAPTLRAAEQEKGVTLKEKHSTGEFCFHSENVSSTKTNASQEAEA